MPDPAAVLRAFADLAPSGASAPLDVSRAYGPFVPLVDGGAPRLLTGERTPTLRLRSTAALRRLAALDALHRDERLLRVGWGFVTGSAELGGSRRRVCLPLLTRPVRLASRRAAVVVSALGDLEVSEHVADPDDRAALEVAAAPLLEAEAEAEAAAHDALAAWLRDAAAAAGLPAVHVVADGDRAPADGLVVAPSLALFAARDVADVGLAATLRAWAEVDGLAPSAFAALCAGPGAGPAGSGEEVAGRDGAEVAAPVRSPLPLTDAQADVVRRARHAPVTVVSGAPGSGKSHALVAAAIDAVAAGRSVLVATASLEAAEVLAGLLERHPGPQPVVFGSSERREALATSLAAGLPAGPSAGKRSALRTALAEAEVERSAVEEAVTALLAREVLAARAPALEPLVPDLRAAAPGAFALDSDLDGLAGLLAQARRPAGGWWDGRRRARAERRLRRRAGARTADLPRIGLALEAASARRAAATLAAEGGTRVGAAWTHLEAARAEVAARLGAVVAADAAALPDRARPAVAALGAALRAGRGRRRELLARMDGSQLVAALPLWIGTLRDVEDLLPRVPGLFDLVVLDEASQIDQLRAAPALLRGRRAVVAGDPRQLTHVSFVADLDVADRLAAHGLAPHADRLDVRRASALDLAAAAAPAVWLDEHFRSVPHLIAFSAERFYPQPIRLVTRHPRNESLDAIDVVRVDGRRDGRGVNRAEVEAVAAALRDLRGAHVSSIAVVSPFRAQADALEEMLVAGYDATAIRALDLRSGTVHQLQGGERDVVVVSLAVTAQDRAARRFVEDPSLFNVMVTRARRRMIVVTSLPEDVDGLIGAYLAHAATPPDSAPAPAAAPAAAPADDAYPRAIAAELAALGHRVRCAYPVGRWTIDLCVGESEDAVAVECGVHPDGPTAHIARHLQLRRAGWRLLEVHPSAHDGDPARAALELAVALRPAGRGGP
jgi:hypothetical protein